MSYRPVQTRAPKNATKVRCPRCHKRLALLWPGETQTYGGGRRSNGYWLHQAADTIHGTMAANGKIKDLRHEGWTSVTCKRCGYCWQGQETYLHDLVANAPGGDVRLGQPVVSWADGPPLRTTRDY